MKKFSRAGYDTQITLSSEELFEISQEIAVHYSPKRIGLFSSFDEYKTLSNQNKIFNTKLNSQYSDTRLSMEEILKINQEISLQYAPSSAESRSDMLLLPVDPFHIYAYWPEVGMENPHIQPLYLRVYWHPDGLLTTTAQHIWFDVPLNSEKNRQQLRVPLSGEYYSAAVGSLDADANFFQLAHSNTVQVPSVKQINTTFEESSIMNNLEQSKCILINRLPNFDESSDEHNARIFFSALTQFDLINDDAIHNFNDNVTPTAISSYKLNSLAPAKIR